MAKYVTVNENGEAMATRGRGNALPGDLIHDPGSACAIFRTAAAHSFLESVSMLECPGCCNTAQTFSTLTPDLRTSRACMWRKECGPKGRMPARWNASRTICRTGAAVLQNSVDSPPAETRHSLGYQ